MITSGEPVKGLGESNADHSRGTGQGIDPGIALPGASARFRVDRETKGHSCLDPCARS